MPKISSTVVENRYHKIAWGDAGMQSGERYFRSTCLSPLPVKSTPTPPPFISRSRWHGSDMPE
jgi:hypothetical protein